jgi:hypothetical protein
MRELIDCFEEMDSTTERLNQVNEKIKDIIGVFGDEEESDNPKVKDLIEKKEFLLERIEFYRKKAYFIIGDLKYKTLECDYFVRRFADTQTALDYINAKLEKYTLIYGVRELITGLGYSRRVGSYSTFNLLYAQYKILEVFKVEGILY